MDPGNDGENNPKKKRLLIEEAFFEWVQRLKPRRKVNVFGSIQWVIFLDFLSRRGGNQTQEAREPQEAEKPIKGERLRSKCARSREGGK